MTATEAVKMQLRRILEDTEIDPLSQGMRDARDAAAIFEGLEKDTDFRMFAQAHADMAHLAPAKIALSLIYCGYMAAKLEAVSDVKRSN